MKTLIPFTIAAETLLARLFTCNNAYLTKARVTLRLLLILPVMLSGATTQAQQWIVQQIDTVGIRPSLALDTYDTPHVVYFDYPHDALPRPLDSARVMYAKRNPATGVFEKDTVVVGSIHPLASFAIGPDGSPHFIYHRHDQGGDPFHSFRVGSTWMNENIPTQGHDGFSPSIAIDSFGSLHVGFLDPCEAGDPDGPGVEYAYFDGVNWTIESTGSECRLSQFTGTSVASDRNGVPSISYYDSVRHDLMLAQRVAGVWSINAVDSVGDVGRFSSLVIDSEGFPRIAYYRNLSVGSGIVRLATMTDQGWLLQDIDTLFSVVLDDQMMSPEAVISLRLGPTGQSIIAYSDEKLVKVARVAGLGIEYTVILDLNGSDRILGQSTSLAVDSRGFEHLTFYENFGDSLGICYYASPDAALPTPRIPCEAIIAFNAKCGPTGQAQVIARMAGNWSGLTVTFDLDGQDYFSTVMSSGTNSIAKLVVPNIGPGLHTAVMEMSVEDKVNCASPVSFSCSGESFPDPEWDALLQEYDDMIGSSPLNPHSPAARIGVPNLGLTGNYPNPFNPSTTIRYTLGITSPISVRVYNMLGQEVTTLVDDIQKAGEHSVDWHGTDNLGRSVASGLYLCRIQAGAVVQTLKMMYLR